MRHSRREFAGFRCCRRRLPSRHPCRLNRPSAWSQAATTMKIVVPFAPGGPTDTMARLLAEPDRAGTRAHDAEWAIRPGAGSTIGTEAVSRAMPDGSALLVQLLHHQPEFEGSELRSTDLFCADLHARAIATLHRRQSAHRPSARFADLLSTALQAPRSSRSS